MKVFNLSSEETSYFDDDVGALWAVVYCYCEENKRLSKLFSWQQKGKFESFAKRLPIIVGSHSISCGDWATKLDNHDAVPKNKKLH